MSNELLPCPFCGSDNIKSYKTDMGVGMQTSTASCKSCKAEISLCSLNAASSWNTRATPQIDVDALKEDIPNRFAMQDRTDEYDDGYRNAIDHLAAAGYLRAPLERIDRLQEAIEFRREIAEFSIKQHEKYFGMNKDRPEISLDTILWMGACAYAKLQGGK